MLWFGVCRPRIAFFSCCKKAWLHSRGQLLVGHRQGGLIPLGKNKVTVWKILDDIICLSIHPSFHQKQISYPLLRTPYFKIKSKLIIALLLQRNFDLPAFPTLWNHEPQWHLETVVSHEFELLSPFQVDLATCQFVLSQDMSRSSTAAVGRFHMFPIKACSPWRNLFGSLDPQHGVFETLNSKKS